MMRWLAGLFTVALLYAGSAHAVLKIEITQGVEGAMPIAIVPFAWDAPPPIAEKLDEIVAADLRASGYFAPLDKKNFISWPTEGTQVRYADWRMLGAESLVVGSVRAVGTRLEVRYQLFDVGRGVQIEGYRFAPKDAADLRGLAHHISDQVYKALTGERGAFSTRIAYVVADTDAAGKANYELQIADYDGANPQTILRSPQSIISPAWSPDGTRLAYASFEHGPVTVYIQDLASGRRERLLDSKDQVSAPAWSPDGTELAVVISRAGKREIYLVKLAGRTVWRLTSAPSGGFHTEPAWSPDGKSVIYTAFAGGQPQIYQVDRDGGKPHRITFDAKYNSRATYSPDGKLLAMVYGDDAGYHIAAMELGSGNVRVLTRSRLDESPTFSPNGRLILFATRDRNRGVLSAVSADGRVSQRIGLEGAGDVREPAWGPFLTP
jgi:TolB protein